MNHLLKYLLLCRLRLLSAGLLILWAGGGAMQAAKLEPGAWKIYPLNMTNVLTNLTDNNPATFVTLTNSVGLFSFTDEQIAKADVSGDKNMSAYDAALIAQYAVRLIGNVSRS